MIRAVLSVMSVALLLAPANAVASDGTSVVCNRDSVCNIVANDGSYGPKGQAPAESDTCKWRGAEVPCTNGNGAFNPADGCYAQTANPPPTDGPVYAEYKAHGGSIVWETCPYGGSGGYVWRPGGVAKPQVTPELVRAEAQRLVPSAAVGLAPHGTTLINIQTVMWADAPDDQDLATVTLLGRRVAIHLRLDAVAWDFGDGHGDPQGPPGKPYDNANAPCRARLCPGYYGHVYDRTGPVEVTARASWRASFTVDGGAVQQIDEPVAGPRAQAEILVRQARAVLVPNPGEH